MIKITKKIMTSNACYKSGRKITPKGIMFHSTATEGVMAGEWYNRWNNDKRDIGVHFFVDDKSIYQYLPCEIGNVHRASHSGGNANNTHISVEMCEPKDKFNNKEYFEKAYRNMLDLFTYLCKTFNLSANSIVGHCEGHKLGIASNHADPNHYLPKMGKTMDMFRAEVAHRLAQPTVEPQKAQPKVDAEILKLQKALNKLRFVGSNGKALTEDGLSGNNTKYATETFQKTVGIKVDGVAGSQTWDVINQILARPLIKKGVKNAVVRYIQYRIGTAIDGDFGNGTERAIKSWQKINGLVVDGIVGNKSWDKLI